jgi:glucose-1-phosphate cytidylyltransferase
MHNHIAYFSQPKDNWNVLCADTGLNTLTAGRLKKLDKYITDHTFFCTYGDGVANIDLDELLKFHNEHGKIATITAIKAPGRFGSLQIEKGCVNSFEEKSSAFINGGFMVFNEDIFDYLDEMLEKNTLPNLVKDGQLMAYEHKGFWHCMDVIADKENLEKIWKEHKSWNGIKL